MHRSSRPVVLGLLIAVCLLSPTPVATADPAPSAPSNTASNASNGSGGPSGLALAGVVAQATTPLATQAKDALTEVKQIFAPGTAAPSTSQAPDAGPVDATMALRDLSRTYQALPAKQRAVAARYLARPTNGTSNGCPGDAACYSQPSTRACDAKFCIHYVAPGLGNDAVPSGTFNGVPPSGGVPGYVRFTLQQMEDINSTYLKAGYRATRSDGTQGGDSRFDVYLANIGPKGAYGYCTSDDPEATSDSYARTHPLVSAYCVLDNNYSEAVFRHHTAAQNLQVTAAHEYFHAVQFAYDYDEDAWLMEATATWAEDELYTSINDNRQYLRYGPEHLPAHSLDAYSGVNEYGAWAFFRHLTERFRASQGGLPVIIRQIWNRAANRGPSAKRMYSLQAINAVLRTHHSTLAHQFTQFALANRTPATSYREGAAYPAASVRYHAVPTRAKPRRTTRVTLRHLAAGHLHYRPGAGLRRTSHLRVAVTGPNVSHGEAIAVRIKRFGHAPVRRTFRLNRRGDGTHRFAFGRGQVQWIEVTVLNTSSAYRCNLGGAFGNPYHTCQGAPRYNANRTTVKATALR